MLWHENGALKAEGTLVEGQLEGWWVYRYENGQELAEGELREGKQEGPWRYWHPDGSRNLGASGMYADDERVTGPEDPVRRLSPFRSLLGLG